MHSWFLAEWARESGGRIGGSQRNVPGSLHFLLWCPVEEKLRSLLVKEKCELLITTLVSQPPVQSPAAPKRVGFCLALYCLATHTHLYIYMCVVIYKIYK